MKYRIEISSVAEAEADSAFLRLSQLTSAIKASKCTQDCYKLLSLYRKCQNVALWQEKMSISVKKFDN